MTRPGSQDLVHHHHLPSVDLHVCGCEIRLRHSQYQQQILIQHRDGLCLTLIV